MTKYRSKIYLLAALILVGIFTLLKENISPYYYQILIYIGINIILASSLNVINGFAGQFSLGHAGFMAVGAYSSALATSSLGILPHSFIGYPLFFLALLGGGVIAAALGLIVGIPSLRLKGDYLAITTLGFGEIIRVVIQNLEFLGAARGFTGIAGLSNSFWVFGFAAVLIFLIYNLIHSTYGKGFLAVRDDEVAAAAIGIDVTRHKTIAFVFGAFFAGIAGGLYAHFVTYINPSQFGFLRSFEIVVMVVVGGMGNIIGVIISAVVLTILPEALRAIAQYRMVIYALLLIIIMLFREGEYFKRRLKLPKILKKSGAEI
jgi:branched-chain amino acid transport system permease protein